MELGGNIELHGFDELDGSELIILKKIIGNFARKFSDGVKDYKKLSITLKKAKGKNKFEVNATLDADKTTKSEVTETNVFVVISEVLKKIESQVFKN